MQRYLKLPKYNQNLTVSLTKFLTNGFRSSFEIPEVRYELQWQLRSCQSSRELRKEEFHAKFRSSSRAKFASPGVVGLVI